MGTRDIQTPVINLGHAGWPVWVPGDPGTQLPAVSTPRLPLSSATSYLGQAGLSAPVMLGGLTGQVLPSSSCPLLEHFSESCLPVE